MRVGGEKPEHKRAAENNRARSPQKERDSLPNAQQYQLKLGNAVGRHLHD